jgi:methyl-accepting chemotaxis protein
MAGSISNNVNQLYRDMASIGKNSKVASKTKVSSDKTKANDKSSVFGTGIGNSATVSFSPEAEMFGKVADMLQKKYENADIFVAGSNDDLSQIGGDLEYSIILSEDEMKLLASDDEKDKEAKEKLLGQIDDAMKQISDMSQKINENTDENDSISNFGISIGKDGKMNFFADINGNSYKNDSLDSIIKSLVTDKTKE